MKKDGSPGRLVSFDVNRAQSARMAQIRAGEIPESFLIPCGKCINCRRNKGFQWSRRLMMESDAYDEKDMCFLTLTYNDFCLPSDGLLHPEHSSAFLKVLRESLRRRDPGVSLRYFLAGEYGDQFDRPHYHLILFGYNFYEGAKLAGYGSDGLPLFSHPLLDKAWDKGFASFGSVTPASMQYVAGYVTKKFRKDNQKEVPPFIRMSTRPGIGNRFLLDHKDSIIRDGGFCLKGRFYALDGDSFRFMIRNGFMSEDDQIISRIKKSRIADIRSRMSALLFPSDSRLSDRILAAKYALDNRLWDAVPTMR